MAQDKKPTPRNNSTPRRASGSRATRTNASDTRATRASTSRGREASATRASRSSGAAQSRTTRTRASQSRTTGAGGSPKPKSGLNPRTLRIIAGAVAGVVVVVLVAVFAVPAIAQHFDKMHKANNPARATLVAVGDNLPDEFVGYFADNNAGEMGDGLYDYSPIYEPLSFYIKDADVAYVNEETHLGGDEIGPQGYPSFNTTDAMATAIVNAGFDFVASATNHSYDWGLAGAIEHSLSVWEKQPVAFTGTAVTKEQYERIVTVERNGITFALLNYTYGVNGFEQSELPKYAVNFIDKKRIAADVALAHQQADVVLVAMHWGTELLMEADEEQQSLAQFLADLNVDVVLGSHPHVIGPMAWVQSSIHPNHRTLVAYSLGNFLADHEDPSPESALEGMLTCDFVKTEDNGIELQNIRWIPLICHVNEDRSEFAIYAVQDYPEDLAKQNRSLTELSNPKQWLTDKSKEVVGTSWFA